jgi:demethylmenaquinone methyltransferase/2-methoxy-6-polyprenyl-1,4-benzoquinol methylase
MNNISRVTRSKDAARTAYNRMSRWYDLFTSSEERFTDLGLRMLNVQPGEKVLEIGFGAGQGLVALAHSAGETGKVYGIDLSEGMFQVAQEKIARTGLSSRVELHLGDAASLPFEDDFFDAIFISFTLELFDTPEIPLVLGECKRVLREDGRLGVVAMAKGGGLAVRLYERGHDRWPSLLDCRPIPASKFAAEAGFQKVETTVKSMWGLPVEIVIARKP